jgi:uncharacterized protein DUF6011
MYTNVQTRQMFAKFAGRCGDCRSPIAIGDPILWAKGAAVRHVSCPAAKPAPAPQAAQAPRELPILLFPTEDTREGRMLLAGQLTATVTIDTGEHVTLTLKSKNRTAEGWENAELKRARYVFVKAGDTKIATCYPEAAGLALNLDPRATPAASQALRALIDHMAGVAAIAWRIQSADTCGRCGRELTDPISLDRGIGPDCWGQITGSKHAQVWK